MKKILNKINIFSFILGAIIFGGIVGVSAYTIFANDVGYTPTDENWKKADGSNITNVKEAIDELYTRTNNNKSIDLTTKTIATENGNCYTLKKTEAFIEENILFIIGLSSDSPGMVSATIEAAEMAGVKVIRIKADKVVEDCNSTYAVDISDLELSTISYKNSFDLSNSINYHFYNTNTTIDTITLKADTNYGAGVKQNYDFVAYYTITK